MPPNLPPQELVDQAIAALGELIEYVSITNS
jgi:hypothetical protein